MNKYKTNLAAIDWTAKRPRQPRKKETPPKRGDFCTPIVLGDYEAYDCPITGKMIEGKAAHRENLKRNNCRLLEKGESRDQHKRVNKSYDDKIERILRGE